MRPINLLPPEVSTQRRRRRRVIALIGLAVAYVALLVLGVVYWNGKVADAEADVAAQQEINQGLQREVAQLSEAGGLRAEFEAKAELIRIALGADVDWGALLNDLSRQLPPTIWVREFSGNVATIPGGGLVGQVSFSAVGFDYPDVSDWVRALDSDNFAGLGSTWVSTMADSIVGDSPVVEFSSTAILSQAAITDRAEDLIPEVP